MTVPDLYHALMWPIRVEAYPGIAENGGTLWRVSGKDVDGDKRISAGIELYEDEGNWVAVCTVFASEKS